MPVDFVCSSEFGEGGEIKFATATARVPSCFMDRECGPGFPRGGWVSWRVAFLVVFLAFVWDFPMFFIFPGFSGFSGFSGVPGLRGRLMD